MSRPPTVAVCVLSWNGRHHLEVCLPALRAQEAPGVEWEVLVLDNGSDDGTAGWVRREHPWVRFYRSPVNIGFAAGNRMLAERTEADFVAFLNNDTRPVAGWLGELVAALAGAPDDVAAVSGRIVDWEGERLDFGRGVMTFDGHAFQLDFRRPLATARVPGDGEELLFPCGGNMLVRRASFEAAGGFDDDYFAYLEDVDLGWRLWAGGERVIAAPGAVVHHRSAATSELLGLYNRGFLFERNAFATVYKNYEAEHWERLMPAILLTLVSRTQTLVVQNNPGTATLTLDPYAGHIANTAEPGAAAARDSGPANAVRLPPRTMRDRWREHGTVELARRGWGRLGRLLGAALPGGGGRLAEPPRLTDPRTVAQLRVLTQLLAHLDGAAAKRAAVQARRRRPDREIFERFPLYLVPTYPGDERLFSSSGFASWLPDDLPLVRSTLEEVMAWEKGR